MGIRKQLNRTVILSTISSMILIFALISVAFNSLFQYYQEAIKEDVMTILAEQGIDGSKIMASFKNGEFSFTARGRADGPPPIFGIVFSGGILMLIISGTSAIFTRKVTRQILLPLEKLKEAANHVSAGDLDYPLDFHADNELASVRDAFSEMQEHLRQSIQENLHQEQSRKELMAGISHDLRTPLTAIKGYVRGLQDGVASTPEKQQQYLDTISTKAQELEGLVDRLFQYSKLDTGNEPMNFSIVDSGEYLAGFIGVVSRDMEQKGLRIVYQPRGGPVSLSIDCDQMSRVLTNILENSAKYKTRPTGTVTFAGGLHQGQYVLEISDDGSGVPEETLPKLFDAFYRADPSRTTSQKSSGLGLAIAERIITAHGGSIHAANRGGLVITITLPVSGEVKQ